MYNWYVKAFEGLLDIISRLRGRNGCPWDRKQTHKSLKPYVIEEAYEVVSAIDSGDPSKLKDELGDLLLQVVLHAQIAKGSGKFGIEDVIKSISEKMVRRHPHVFSGKKASSVEQVWKNWEAIKKTENGPGGSILDTVPSAMPALYRAEKLQKKASRVGFDWDDVAGAWSKVHEEINEIRELLPGKKKNLSHLEEELGDLLFAVTNVTRKLGLRAEECLDGANKKFTRRFKSIEKAAKRSGKDLHDMSLDEMEKLWEKAKSSEKR